MQPQHFTSRNHEGVVAYQQHARETTEELVNRHASLVHRIARHIQHRLPDHVDLDDLIQAGMVGLLEAAQSFDDSREASFATWAGIRIRGAIMDEMRRGDWAPRSVHRASRAMARAIRILEHRLGRSPDEAEIAREMEISLDEYRQLLNDTRATQLFSFDEVMDQGGQENRLSSHDDTPEAVTEKILFRQALADAIRRLPEREQQVLSLYYNEEMNLKEIGLILGVSESRVSQLHSQAAHRLRAALEAVQ